MKLFYAATKPYLSNAFLRIEQGLRLTAPPGITFVNNSQEADFVILPVVGENDAKNLVPDKTILWQLVYELAGGKEIWKPVWEKSKLVISYLDLPTDYLSMPLGYDPKIFYYKQQARHYPAVVTGFVDGYPAEEISSVWKTFHRIAHIGKDFNLGNGYKNFHNLTDEQVADLYRDSIYVGAMRHKEGFELPALEGYACGCTPIMLDLPCYRKWFEGVANFVDPNNVMEGLSKVRLMPRDEEFLERFTWQKVMEPLWKALN